MVTAWADGDEACLRSAFLWEKPGLHIQQLEKNILESYRPNCLKTECEVTESASAARQDEHILREKMKLGHKIWEKRRKHTYRSLAIPRLLGISDQVSGSRMDFTETRMILIFRSLLKKTQILQVLLQKQKEFLTFLSCVSLVQPHSWAVIPRRGGQLFPFLSGSGVPAKGRGSLQAFGRYAKPWGTHIFLTTLFQG